MRRVRSASVTAMAALVALLPGCRVMTIEQAEALHRRDAGVFDARAYAASIWTAKALPLLRDRAVGIEALGGDRAELGARHGHRAGEGSPYTLVVGGTGVVEQVDRASPKGRIALATGAGPVLLQTGTVVSGTAVRDALPFVSFDQVPDQIAFAELGDALTERALAPLRPRLAALRPGQRVRFTGVAPLGPQGAPLLVTPIAIDAAS